MRRSLLFLFFPKKKLIALFLLRIFLNGFNVIISVLIQIALSYTLSGQTSKLTVIFIAMAAGAGLYILMYYLSGIVLESAKKSMSVSLATGLIKVFVDRENAMENGEAINLISQDIINAATYVEQGLLPLFDFGVTILLGAVYVGTQSLTILGVFILAAGILTAAAQFLYRHQAVAQREIMLIDDKHKSFFETFLRTIPVLKNLQVGSYALNKHASYFEEKKPLITNFSKIAGFLDGIFTGGIYFVEILVLLIGYLLVSQQKLSLPAMLGTWNAGVGSLLWPFLSLPVTLNFVVQQRTSIARIMKCVLPDSFSLETETKPSVDEERNSNAMLVVKNMSFRYSDQDVFLFKNFNSTINSRGMTFIIGENGTGKTTLLKLLLGLITPTSGSIIYSRGSAQPEDVSLKNALLSFVPQRSIAFDDTLRNNLTLGKKIDTSTISKALDAVNLHDFISTLDQPLQADELSPGQLRRLAIARAIIVNRPWIILDEPFSDIDKESRRIILDTLQTISKTRGVIIVTHTFEMIRPDDTIIKVVKP